MAAKVAHDTETTCHCGAEYGGSDHCPVCMCEQYETTCTEIHVHAWIVLVAQHGPEAPYGCQQCPATTEGAAIGVTVQQGA